MNNERRKQIKAIIKGVEVIQSEINKVLEDEQYAYDNMPEGLQNSDKGMNSEESIELLESAIEKIDDCINDLSGII
ncbi:MAG: hypothetical protein IK081_13910 [Lachnospiraceae bacterium]|nr:hypothetical protein [Lachnospiraceae bacterium]